jgi:oxygen-independent coproporphyrinogen-3 oxidase
MGSGIEHIADVLGTLNGVGLYIHVPFCARRCDYCAFVTTVGADHLIDSYVDACVEHLRAATDGAMGVFATAYLGGGTPSRLAPNQVARLLRAAPLARGAEVTIECNPEDVSPDRLRGFVDAGVTRVSVGVQSTVPSVLASLGRRTVEDAVNRVANAVEGVGLNSWSIDLIYGAAGETDEDLERTLAEVLAVDPPHLSVYALSVEPGTPLARAPHRFPDDDTQADRYLWLSRRLADAGYEVEEISSWAKPGHACRHHAIYWSGGDYLGIGTGAHGHVEGRRTWNTVSVERYIEAISEGRSPVVGEELLDEEARAFERLALELRTANGVDARHLDLDAVAHLGAAEPLVEVVDGRAILTAHGRLLANAVVQCLQLEERQSALR